MLRGSQIASGRGEDGRTDDDVCQPASGLQPDECDVTRLRAKPEVRVAPNRAQVPPARSHREKAKRDRASIKHLQQRRRDDAHIKATLCIGVEPVF